MVKETLPSITLLSSIKVKFASLVITAGLVSCAVVGTLSYEIGKRGLIEASKTQLQIISANQNERLRSYSTRIDQALAELAANAAIGEAISNMEFAADAEKEKILALYQPSGSTAEARAEIEPRNSKLIYAMSEAKIRSGLVAAWKNANVSDIYVVGLNGFVPYSVTKSRELFGNIETADFGPLSSLYKKMKGTATDGPVASGFVTYDAEDGQTSAFLARPLVVEEWGKATRKGYVVVRISTSKISSIMKDNVATAPSTSSFLVSHDLVRAGEAHFTELPAGLVQLKKSQEQDKGEITYNEAGTLLTYAAVNVFGEASTLFVGQPLEVILSSARSLALAAISVTFVVLVAIAGAGYFVSARLTKPLIELAKLMERLRQGDKSIKVEDTLRKDEIGVMARSLEAFRAQAIEKEEVEKAIAEQALRTEQERYARDGEKLRNSEEMQAAVAALAKGLKALASGNLAARIEEPFVVSLDQLRVDYNEALQELEETIITINQSVSQIAGGASKLEKASECLAKRTEYQAASLEEAAAAIAEIADAMAGNRQECSSADRVVGKALGTARSASEVVSQANAAMSRIQKSSIEISSIIGVIDQISFQTNLLALNAGVEAARAGESGKGFAVVAHEVRELAQRSAAAARDISYIINSSVADVERGATLVAETGQCLSTIEGSVEDIHRHIASIVRSTTSQSERLSEINGSVAELDKVTQQNVTMVEETAAAAIVLASEASVLSDRISAFSTSPLLKSNAAA